MRHVAQAHGQGCFYAGLAMLLGCSYVEAFRRVHRASSDINRLFRRPILRADRVPAVLERLGLSPREVRCRRVRSLKHDALIVVRWHEHSMYSHTVVWDSKGKRILDPGSRVNPLSTYMVEQQLYAAYEVSR